MSGREMISTPSLLSHPSFRPPLPAELLRSSSLPAAIPRPSRVPSLSSSASCASRRGNAGPPHFSHRCTGGKGGRDGGDLFEDFSVLSTDIPWDCQSIWSIMAAYFFSLHVPLSFGGLPAICQILNQPILDPLTETASLVLLQTLEVTGALMLLHYSAKKEYKLSSLFQHENPSEERNWIKAATFGLGFLMLVVLLSSFLADRLIGTKDVNNPELKDILLSGQLPKVAFFFIYCFITPMLEEAIYRGFLLTSLATTMKWQRAVITSAFVFSLAHFSSENFPQLFFIGCVLGSAYCWSGNLAASFIIHSVYNAMILLVTVLS